MRRSWALMSWDGTQEQRGWQVQRPWGGANAGTSLPFLRSAVIFMAVLVSCGCYIKLLYRRWLNKTEVYSLIVLEAKKSETKVSAGHTPSGGSRGRSLLSLSSSGCGQHFLTCSGVNPQSLYPHVTVSTPICQACLGPTLTSVGL